MKNYRDQKYLNLNADDFIKIKTPQHAYLLGLIWADGHITTGYKKKGIRIELTRCDMEQLIPIFNVTGKWNFTTRKRVNRKEQMSATICNAKFVDYLINLDYNNKSTASPRIINIISKDFLSYFLQGWIDGDGCFYHSKTANQFYLSGSFKQDWNAIENIFNEYNLRYSIQRITTNHGYRYSCLRITSKKIIKRLGDIVYPDGFKFGLIRKYDKYKTIINSININNNG